MWEGKLTLRCDQDMPYTQPNQESTATQQAKKTIAATKQIFPNMRKTPSGSGSSFLPSIEYIGRILTSLYL